MISPNFHFPAFKPLKQKSANFSVKCYVVHILGFAGHTFSVSTTQLCPSSSNEATDNMERKAQLYSSRPITSLAASPTKLPLLHHALATVFLFLEHSKLLHWGLCTCCSILWAALLPKQHMSDSSQFIIINSGRFP